jgi:type II secretory pathway component PulF
MKLYPNLFLRIMIDMCSIGERTGNLALMFGHCSRIFEQDIDLFLKRFSSLIEPVLMIFMGLIVGSIALSIILPVYEITNHLSK